MLAKETLEGNWKSIVGAVREKFSEITGDELGRIEGNVEQLIGLIQRKSGQSREQIESFLESSSRPASSTINRVTNQVSDYADVAGQAVRENYDRIASEAQRGYDYSVRTMQRRPLESVVIALGAGVLAGLVLGISMSSRRR